MLTEIVQLQVETSEVCSRVEQTLQQLLSPGQASASSLWSGSCLSAQFCSVWIGGVIGKAPLMQLWVSGLPLCMRLLKVNAA